MAVVIKNRPPVFPVGEEICWKLELCEKFLKSFRPFSNFSIGHLCFVAACQFIDSCTSVSTIDLQRNRSEHFHVVVPHLCNCRVLVGNYIRCTHTPSVDPYHSILSLFSLSLSLSLCIDYKSIEAS